jgi:hypothetical protein
MIHAEPWDTDRCPVDEVWHTDIPKEEAMQRLETGRAIACRRCGVKNLSKPGDIPILFGMRPE